MERFYQIAVLFTLIFLIVCLIIIGILMQYHNASKKFPLHPTVCPDTWTTNDNGLTCSTITGNKGKAGTTNSLTLSTVPNICDKKKWTTTTGVHWDGVSNYTGCA
jgi:hypothetical protein